MRIFAVLLFIYLPAFAASRSMGEIETAYNDLQNRYVAYKETIAPAGTEILVPRERRLQEYKEILKEAIEIVSALQGLATSTPKDDLTRDRLVAMVGSLNELLKEIINKKPRERL